MDTATEDRSVGSRVGPACGLVFVGLLVAVVTQVMGGDPGVRPGDPAGEIHEAVVAGVTSVTWPWMVALSVALGAFVVFLADLQQRLADRTGPAGRWVGGAVLAGGLLVIVGIMMQALLWAGLRTVVGHGVEEPAVAVTLFALTWEGPVTMLPGIVVMTVATAVASLRYRALPIWLGVLAAVAFVVALVAYWVPIWLVWVAATAVALLVAPSRPGDRAAREASVGVTAPSEP